MKAQILILSMNVLFFLCCNSPETKLAQSIQEKAQMRDSLSKSQTKPIVQSDMSNAEVIYDDEFIIRTIEDDLSLSNIQEIYQPKKIRENLLPNKYNLDKKDTLIFFSVGFDSIEFYKGGGNTLPQKMVITSEKLTIDKTIKIGTDKNFFRRRFNTKLLSDTLVVRDIEGGNIFTFFFQKNNLVKFLYQAEYTD